MTHIPFEMPWTVLSHSMAIQKEGVEVLSWP